MDPVFSGTAVTDSVTWSLATNWLSSSFAYSLVEKKNGKSLSLSRGEVFSYL